MDVRIESILFLQDKETATLFLDLVNTIVLTRNEGELRREMAAMADRTPLGEFFVYGYGKSHLWLKQRVNKGSEYCHDKRLSIVEF